MRKSGVANGYLARALLAIISMKQERRLNITKYQAGFPVAGRCSACQRPFEVDFSIFDSLSTVEKELNALFDAHNCADQAEEYA